MNDELPHLVVFGGRDFADATLLYAKLDHFTAELGKLVVVTGDATGADRLAAAWALDRKHTLVIHYADWDTHGKSAGPLRNLEMVNSVRAVEHKFAVAFHDGKSRGTADTLARVRAAGIPLRLVKY